MPPSNRKEIREKETKTLTKKEDHVKIVIIILLIIVVVFLGIYITRRLVFNKQINSKSIENYGKNKPKKNKNAKYKNKINSLTEEYLDGENV